MLTELSVGGDYVQIPTGMVDNLYKRGVTIDSGTNLAYLPDVLYNRVMRRVSICFSANDSKNRFF